MNNVNQVQVLFSFMILSIIVLGSLINSFGEHLPCFIQQFFRYGKFSYEGNSFITKTYVPKSWFKHFYVYSSILTSFALGVTIAVYLFNYQIPQLAIDILNVAGGNNRIAYVNSASVLLAVILLTFQCCRRFYDTHYISVFSKNGRMNLSHYLVGHLHYTGAIFAIFIEAPKFVENSWNYNTFALSDITYLQWAAVLLFFWSWWHQYKVTVILANLRKDNKGCVVSQAHKLPHGDWFDYVSSPQNLSEILMYVALTIILWKNVTWLYVLAWVLSNQVETALLSHWWYQENFKDLPIQRKAIIPFIY